MDLHETAQAITAEVERINALPMFSKAAALPNVIGLQLRFNSLVLAELDRLGAEHNAKGKP